MERRTEIRPPTLLGLYTLGNMTGLVADRSCRMRKERNDEWLTNFLGLDVWKHKGAATAKGCIFKERKGGSPRSGVIPRSLNMKETLR